MLIYTPKQNYYAKGPAILDTESGLVYQMGIGKKGEFDKRKKDTFPLLMVSSCHETTEQSYGTRFEDEAADIIWNQLLSNVVNFEDVGEFDLDYAEEEFAAS